MQSPNQATFRLRAKLSHISVVDSGRVHVNVIKMRLLSSSLASPKYVIEYDN
jgi:hypothetical protein